MNWCGRDILILVFLVFYISSLYGVSEYAQRSLGADDRVTGDQAGCRHDVIWYVAGRSMVGLAEGNCVDITYTECRKYKPSLQLSEGVPVRTAMHPQVRPDFRRSSNCVPIVFDTFVALKVASTTGAVCSGERY